MGDEQRPPSRLEEKTREIRRRVERFLPSWSPEQLDALAFDMAKLELKYEARAGQL